MGQDDTGQDSLFDADDRRAAFTELSENLRAGVTVLWDAFKTYFTIAALLFAGVGFLLSSQSPFAPTFSRWVALAISVAAVLITILGGVGVLRILAYQRKFIDRGLIIEADMKTSVFDVSDEVWKASGLFGSDKLTFAVFFIFAAAWLALGGICLACIANSASCPASTAPTQSCECSCATHTAPSPRDAATPARPTRAGSGGAAPAQD